MIASGDPYAVKLAAEYKSAGVMSAFPDLKEDDIECIISYMDSPGFGFGKKMPGNSDTTTVSFHPVTVRGIDPASVKAFWNKDYNNTILATREFEKRMRVIHTTCKQAVLDLYIKNLDKNLWQIDEMASKLLDGDLKRKFQDFARLKNGKVKSDARQVAYLTKYYNKKYEAAKRILKNNLEAQRKLEYAKEVLKETVEGKAFQRQEKLLKEEIELNTKEVYKQLGINPVKQEMAGKEFIKPPVYTASVSSFGWKNIDRLTEERQTFTISENGKTAKITYDLVLVKLKEPQRFDRVMAYLLPDKLSSFMKMKEVDNVFEEQLNKNIHYNLLIVGYEHDDICYFTQPDIKKGLIENIVLSKIHKKDFDQRINGLFSNYSAGIETDFRNEMLSVYQDVQEVRDKVSARKINGIRAELYHVVFPCADGYIYTKPTDPDLE